MRRLAGPLVLLALATVPLWLANPYHVHILIQAGIFSVLALSLNLLLGYAGQLSLGHAAFFGIGAYASALLTLKLEWLFLVGFAAALALPAVAGWAIGRLALKLRGAYFVLVTISFAGVISLVSVNWMELTNGPLGLPGIPPAEVGGFVFRTKTAVYYLVLAVGLATYVLCARIVRSQSGDFTRSEGKEVMESFLRAENGGRDICAVWAHNDEMAIGAALAIEEAGLDPGDDILIVSVDAVPDIFRAMAEGDTNATVELSPHMGGPAFDAIEAYLAGERDIPKLVTINGELYTQATAAEELRRRTGQ